MYLNVSYPEETLGEVLANPQAASSAAVWLEVHSLNTNITFVMHMFHSKNAFPTGNAGSMQEMQKRIPVMPPDDLVVVCHHKPAVFVFFRDQSLYLSKIL